MLDPHRTLQLTPALVVSLLSTARTCACALVCMDPRGAGARPTEMARPPMVRVTLEYLLGLLAEAAKSVTVPFFGVEAGAV